MKKWEKKNKDMLNKNQSKTLKIIILYLPINHKIYIFIIIKTKYLIENNNLLHEFNNHQFYIVHKSRLKL